MKKKEVVKGFKGFNKDLCCTGGDIPFQYEIGKIYTMDENIELCSRGFHFCQKLWDVNRFYSFNNDDNRYCEVEALGKVITEKDGTKSVTNKIKIVREIPKAEFMELVNIGSKNTGFMNTGYMNTGDRNTGDWNKTNRSAGVFCTEEPKLIMFNKETDMSFEEWRNTRAYDLLTYVKKSTWVSACFMTEEEKKRYPSYETCDGYLKEIPRNEASKTWWNNLDIYDKNEIFSLPNFDLDIFNEIMELKITKKEYKDVIKEVTKNVNK